jgi:hypothetical protein
MNRFLALIIYPIVSLSLAACDKTSVTQTPAKGAPFVVDTSKDFHFEIGCGSGSEGLDTIAFGRYGRATLYRQQPQGKWQTTSLKLAPEALERIFDSVRSEKVMQMQSAYDAEVVDGTHWILRITQGVHTKAVYFNNHFPKGITRLGDLVDKELESAGLKSATWKAVPPTDSRKHDQPLWDCIKAEAAK